MNRSSPLLLMLFSKVLLSLADMRFSSELQISSTDFSLIFQNDLIFQWKCFDWEGTQALIGLTMQQAFQIVRED